MTERVRRDRRATCGQRPSPSQAVRPWRCMSNSCRPCSRATGRTRTRPGSCSPGRVRAATRCSRPRAAHTFARNAYLAYDVDYDCALIRLCAAAGIETTPASFGQPGAERARLERALATTGFDLA